MVLLHFNLLCFQYILCSWFLPHLQKICHVQKKKIILFWILPGFQTATPLPYLQINWNSVIPERNSLFWWSYLLPSTPKGREFCSFAYAAAKSQRHLWNWAHYAAYSTKYKAVTTVRPKFSTLILTLWNGKMFGMTIGRPEFEVLL